uniref:Uncharacterized protein n=1 Tax=Picea sitchensis TaxID=3332 RepID=A0A6B9XUK7_PICSI|nr:hypothetical protein Q903MT_gene5834 [Picea sitchensis]
MQLFVYLEPVVEVEPEVPINIRRSMCYPSLRMFLGSFHPPRSRSVEFSKDTIYGSDET